MRKEGNSRHYFPSLTAKAMTHCGGTGLKVWMNQDPLVTKRLTETVICSPRRGKNLLVKRRCQLRPESEWTEEEPPAQESSPPSTKLPSGEESATFAKTHARSAAPAAADRPANQSRRPPTPPHSRTTFPGKSNALAPEEVTSRVFRLRWSAVLVGRARVLHNNAKAVTPVHRCHRSLSF